MLICLLLSRESRGDRGAAATNKEQKRRCYAITAAVRLRALNAALGRPAKTATIGRRTMATALGRCVGESTGTGRNEGDCGMPGRWQLLPHISRALATL